MKVLSKGWWAHLRHLAVENFDTTYNRVFSVYKNSNIGEYGSILPESTKDELLESLRLKIDPTMICYFINTGDILPHEDIGLLEIDPYISTMGLLYVHKAKPGSMFTYYDRKGVNCTEELKGNHRILFNLFKTHSLKSPADWRGLVFLYRDYCDRSNPYESK